MELPRFGGRFRIWGSNGAEKIVSHDSHMKTIAQDRISVEEIPEISEQLNLLGENS